MLHGMEIFVLIILAILTAVVLFWLIIWPTLLLLGAAVAFVAGAIIGVVRRAALPYASP